MNLHSSQVAVSFIYIRLSRETRRAGIGETVRFVVHEHVDTPFSIVSDSSGGLNEVATSKKERKLGSTRVLSDVVLQKARPIRLRHYVAHRTTINRRRMHYLISGTGAFQFLKPSPAYAADERVHDTTRHGYTRETAAAS